MPETLKTTTESERRPALPHRAVRGWGETIGSGAWRVRRAFTRDNVVSFLKTMVWVVPLTLLIWIYAEREQLATEDNIPARIDVKSSDPKLVATLMQPGGEKTIMLTLRGPRSQLDRVKLELSRNNAGIPIDVGSGLEPGKTHTLFTLDQVVSNPMFASNGVAVLDASPKTLNVDVDRLVERQVPVVAPDNVPGLASATFTPPTVTVTAPEEKFQSLQGVPLVAVAQLVGLPILKQPGDNYAPVSVPISLPPALQGEHVTFTPDNVKASLVVKQADVSYTLINVPVQIYGSYFALQDAHLSNFRPTLPSVTVVGPPQAIETLKNLPPEAQPVAVVEITHEDTVTPGPKTKTPIFIKLPDGVHVAKDSADQTVTFTVDSKG